MHNYISDPNVDLSNLSLDSLPDFAGLPTTPLEHGTAYKFRIAAINSCGRGDYSEVWSIYYYFNSPYLSVIYLRIYIDKIMKTYIMTSLICQLN